jgi:mannosyltransferase
MARANGKVARGRVIWWVGLLLILLLAAGLRFFRLDAQSFWNDEGNSARIAERSVRLILEGAAGDIHPPLYYLALHYWRALAGNSEFALRAFSAIGGVLLVAMTALLGARLFAPPAGLAAAFLAAINPFQVYYSQEARSYIWVAFLAAATVYAAWHLNASHVAPPAEAAVNPRVRALAWAVAYVLLVTAGLYTHYLFFLILVPINLVVVVGLILTRSFRWLGVWILLHVLAGVFYLPWAPIAVRQVIGWPTLGGDVTFGQGALETLRLLSLGVTVETEAIGLALLGFGFLLLLGLIPRRSRSRNVALLLVAFWLLLPVGAIFGFQLYREAFLKFLLIVSPAFCLLTGRGLTRFWPPGADAGRTVFFPLALSLGLILSFTYSSLQNLYFDPRYARADYRQMAQDIEAMERPGDAVILNAANQWEVFTYYYPRVDRVYPLPRSRPVDEPAVIAELEEIVARHDRIFAIFWAEAESDPQRIVERWLDAHAYKATDEWWGDVRLVTYAIPAAPPATFDVPLAARFGDRIELHGYTLLSSRLAPADILQVSFFWEALAPIPERYKVFVHLVGPDGRPVAQRDSEPGGGLALTTTWEPGQVIADHYGVLIPPATPPGEYTLAVGLYVLGDPAARLPVTLDGAAAGDLLELETIVLTSQ